MLYGERGLAGEEAVVNIFQDLLTLEYQQEKLSRYSVEWQPDERHLARVGNPRLFHHPYHSAQPELWEPGEVVWFVIIRTNPPTRRRKLSHRLLVVQRALAARRHARRSFRQRLALQLELRKEPSVESRQAQ